MYEKFRKLLNERGLTCYQVYKATGISQSTFTEWKNGTYKPKVDKLMILAEYFGVPLEYFLKED